MIFLADENIDQAVVDRLRADGYEVLSIAELEPRPYLFSYAGLTLMFAKRVLLKLS